jgi:hypothetical protein
VFLSSLHKVDISLGFVNWRPHFVRVQLGRSVIWCNQKCSAFKVSFQIGRRIGRWPDVAPSPDPRAGSLVRRRRQGQKRRRRRRRGEVQTVSIQYCWYNLFQFRSMVSVRMQPSSVVRERRQFLSAVSENPKCQHSLKCRVTRLNVGLLAIESHLCRGSLTMELA